MFQTKVTNSSIGHETQDDTQDSSSTYFSQQTSTIAVQKRTQQAVTSRTSTKKDSNSLNNVE
jgi:hypothetical protein